MLVYRNEVIYILVNDAPIASLWYFLHQANTPMGPPEDFQRSHHPYVAEAEESKLMPWRITDCMWRFFCRRTFINSSWQLNGNWFCKNEILSFKTIIQQGVWSRRCPRLAYEVWQHWFSSVHPLEKWQASELLFLPNSMILGRVKQNFFSIWPFSSL